MNIRLSQSSAACDLNCVCCGQGFPAGRTYLCMDVESFHPSLPFFFHLTCIPSIESGSSAVITPPDDELPPLQLVRQHGQMISSRDRPNILSARRKAMLDDKHDITSAEHKQVLHQLREQDDTQNDPVCLHHSIQTVFSSFPHCEECNRMNLLT